MDLKVRRQGLPLGSRFFHAAVRAARRATPNLRKIAERMEGALYSRSLKSKPRA